MLGLFAVLVNFKPNYNRVFYHKIVFLSGEDFCGVEILDRPTVFINSCQETNHCLLP